MHERVDGGGYVYAHTLEYEKHTGKLPQKNEVLHHIDLDDYDLSKDVPIFHLIHSILEYFEIRLDFLRLLILFDHSTSALV